MNTQESIEKLGGLSDEDLKNITFSIPWQYPQSNQSEELDPDIPTTSFFDTDDLVSRDEVRAECWRKYERNPQINTSVRGLQGRLTGLGFGCSSGNFEVQKVIDEIWLDYRNRLYNFMPKYVGRINVEGELFLILTVHEDGFIEIDFLEPRSVTGGQDGVGIMYHPFKTTLPLFYNIRGEGGEVGKEFSHQIPSIFVARDPLLVADVAKHSDFSLKAQKICRSRKRVYGKLGGFYRFVVAWDRGLITKRTGSYLRTILEWINQYELLKKYEIEHKRSAGSYLWVFTIEDPVSFKVWLSLSDTDRRKTGIMAKKTPGGSLILPPGIRVEVKNPSLPTITEQDTDLLKMVGSGLNEEEGVMTGKSTAPYASIKASRGPMSDRISDEMAWFKNFLLYDFWGSVFLLKSRVGAFPEFIKEEECVGYTSIEKKNEDGEMEYVHIPVFKKVSRSPEFFVEIGFPVSEMIDYEARAKGLMGSKHGPASETLGIPNSEVASRMGFSEYGRSRLKRETEKKKWPKLIYNLDAESLQEKVEAEPKKSSNKKEISNNVQR